MISMTLSAFVSQNRGAAHWDRMKKGTAVSMLTSALIARLIGVILYIHMPFFLTFFTSSPESV